MRFQKNKKCLNFEKKKLFKKNQIDHNPGCVLGLGGNRNSSVWYNGIIYTTTAIVPATKIR